MPERIYSEGLVLPDGRKVRVLAYDDGSVRFRISGTPYVMEEAFLAGGTQDHAIIKIAPRSAAAVAADVAENEQDPVLVLRAQVAALKEQLDAAPETQGPGHVISKHKRVAFDSAFTVILMMIDEVVDARNG